MSLGKINVLGSHIMVWQMLAVLSVWLYYTKHINGIICVLGLLLIITMELIDWGFMKKMLRLVWFIKFSKQNVLMGESWGEKEYILAIKGRDYFAYWGDDNWLLRLLSMGKDYYHKTQTELRNIVEKNLFSKSDLALEEL